MKQGKCLHKIQITVSTTICDFYCSQSGLLGNIHCSLQIIILKKERTSNMKLKCPQCKLSTVPVPQSVTFRKLFSLFPHQIWTVEYSIQPPKCSPGFSSDFTFSCPGEKNNQPKPQPKSTHTNTTSEYSNRAFWICPAVNLQSPRHMSFLKWLRKLFP